MTRPDTITAHHPEIDAALLPRNLIIQPPNFPSPAREARPYCVTFTTKYMISLPGSTFT